MLVFPCRHDWRLSLQHGRAGDHRVLPGEAPGAAERLRGRRDDPESRQHHQSCAQVGPSRLCLVSLSVSLIFLTTTGCLWLHELREMYNHVFRNIFLFCSAERSANSFLVVRSGAAQLLSLMWHLNYKLQCSETEYERQTIIKFVCHKFGSFIFITDKIF